ncbi:hypothetical protein J2T20_001751 [Paenibacillus wynnii]|nr:hypothetical protein [Paenibacillus wynnii]
MLYFVQDFERKGCFRSGIVVLCAGFRAQRVPREIDLLMKKRCPMGTF